MRCANATNLHRKSGGNPTIAFVMVVQETTLTLGSLAMWKLKAVVGASPGFPVQLGGSGALHAAFLKESRIRGRVQSGVQEIRVAPIFFVPGTLWRTWGTRPIPRPPWRDSVL
jgi:hypothetical protein